MMIDDETIAILAAWAAAGNRWRVERCEAWESEARDAGALHARQGEGYRWWYRLSPAGLTIASLATQRAEAWDEGRKEGILQAYADRQDMPRDDAENPYRSKSDET